MACYEGSTSIVRLFEDESKTWNCSDGNVGQELVPSGDRQTLRPHLDGGAAETI